MKTRLFNLFVLLLVIINLTGCVKTSLSSHEVTNNEIFPLKLNQNEQQQDNAIIVNVNEFVAKIQGGIRHARLLANRYNLKLIKQVKKRKKEEY